MQSSKHYFTLTDPSQVIYTFLLFIFSNFLHFLLSFRTLLKNEHTFLAFKINTIEIIDSSFQIPDFIWLESWFIPGLLFPKNSTRSLCWSPSGHHWLLRKRCFRVKKYESHHSVIHSLKPPIEYFRMKKLWNKQFQIEWL